MPPSSGHRLRQFLVDGAPGGGVRAISWGRSLTDEADARHLSSALVLKTQKRSIRTDRSRIKAGRQPGKTCKRLGRRQAKGPPRQQYRSATESICGKSVANRLRAVPLTLSNLPEHVYLQHVSVEPPRGFEPRTYALRGVSTSLSLTGVPLCCSAFERGSTSNSVTICGKSVAKCRSRNLGHVLRMGPGATALTRIAGSSLPARDFVSDSPAALETP